MSGIRNIEVLKLTQRNLSDGKVVDITDNNITEVSSYSFLVKMLEAYKKREFKPNERITEYIKLNLSLDEEKAKSQWFDGVEYDGHTYKAWFATSRGMKQENYGICETIFIREDYQDFAKIVENTVSLGKFKELEAEEKEICINKDVLSRLSLITSDLIAEIDMPNIIILPTATIDWIRDYKTVEPIKTTETNDKGEEVEKIDYNLVDYHFDTNERDENGEPIDEIEIFDGAGIATPRVFESIQKSLSADYEMEFAIIRGYGMAIKGLISKFDIMGYLRETYKEDSDYCRLKDGTFYLLDRWNEWQPVTNNTVILNDSMVKLAKYFSSMEEYKNRLNKLDNETFRDYYNLLNKMYITKVNKPESEIKDYRRTNYQLINALALTPSKYRELTRADGMAFKKIIKPFEHDSSTEEFLVNIDYINLFYKNIVNVDENSPDYEEEIQKSCNNIVDKVNELINIDEEFVKLNFVKRNLGSLVEKRIRDLASGKVTVKGKYQYMACCPISYMNFAMNRDLGDNGLSRDQFYSGDCADGDIRTISRNPLAAYSEVHNVEFARNEFLDRWLSDCKELIYFNQKSDIQNLLSSADFDGDGVTQIDNEIIREAVVVPKDGKYFITLSDGKQKKLKYNVENRFISTYKASGNLIGKIALKAANINSNCQNVPSYWDVPAQKFLKWRELKETWKAENETEDGLKEHIAERLENGELKYSYEVDEELREYMAEKFYEYELEIYIVLYNSMKSIDAPKTLVFPSKDDMKVIDDKYFKKVAFLKYVETAENAKERANEYINTGSMLDDFALNQVQKHLLDVIDKRKKRFSDRSDILQKRFKNEDYSKEVYELCKAEVDKLYVEYNGEREEANRKYYSEISKLDRERTKFIEVYNSWDELREEEYLRDVEKVKEKQLKVYKKLDKKYLPISEVIIEKYGLVNTADCIGNLEKCRENFVISLFWKCFEYINSREENSRYQYVLDENGDIDYLH